MVGLEDFRFGPRIACGSMPGVTDIFHQLLRL